MFKLLLRPAEWVQASSCRTERAAPGSAVQPPESEPCAQRCASCGELLWWLCSERCPWSAACPRTGSGLSCPSPPCELWHLMTCQCCCQEICRAALSTTLREDKVNDNKCTVKVQSKLWVTNRTYNRTYHNVCLQQLPLRLVADIQLYFLFTRCYFRVHSPYSYEMDFKGNGTPNNTEREITYEWRENTEGNQP